MNAPTKTTDPNAVGESMVGDNPTAAPATSPAPSSHSEVSYVAQLYTDWCECSPYGEQVPDEWPHLMTEFVIKHKDKMEEHMAELIMEADSSDPFEKLLESIFRTAALFVLHDLSNAVYDNNYKKLQLIGINGHGAPVE